MRKYITQVTERRINEMRNASTAEGQLLFWALHQFKEFHNCISTWSVKDAKAHGIQLDNYQQIKGHYFYKDFLLGWSILYPEITNYSRTLDMSCWTIYDFNKLVSVVYAETM